MKDNAMLIQFAKGSYEKVKATAAESGGKNILLLATDKPGIWFGSNSLINESTSTILYDEIKEINDITI